MNNDIEKILAKFELKKPSAGLRSKVLATVLPPPSDKSEISAAFKLGVKIYFTAAAMLLISIMLFSSITYEAPKLDIKQREHDIEQAVKLGLPKESAVYTVAVLRNKPKLILTHKFLIQGPLL